MVLVEMREAIGRADSIVRELLEFSAANHPEVADEELSVIMEQSLGLMKFEWIKHRISLVRELSPGLPLLKLDRNKIQQVFINLFLNSIQAMPEGGTLTVRTYASQSPNVLSGTTDPGSAQRCEGFVIAEDRHRRDLICWSGEAKDIAVLCRCLAAGVFVGKPGLPVADSTKNLGELVRG